MKAIFQKILVVASLAGILFSTAGIHLFHSPAHTGGGGHEHLAHASSPGGRKADVPSSVESARRPCPVCAFLAVFFVAGHLALPGIGCAAAAAPASPAAYDPPAVPRPGDIPSPRAPPSFLL